MGSFCRSILMNWLSVLIKHDRKPTFILWSSTAAMAHKIPCMRRSFYSDDFKVHPFVKEAMENGKPVVALESTIITHGMPYPHNLSMAREVEEIARENGCVPATIAILRGHIHVGLQDEELEMLATAKNAMKVSRRDLPYVLSQGLSGGTTVAGTMMVAHKASIPVFVTGGIGGVHRGGEKSLDVSADLTELGRTPVAVISSGVKSILDIGRTLEYLETKGVCVATFGGSREFPAFFSRHSGFQAPYQVQDEKAAAQLIARSLALKLGSGILIAVPCPLDQAVSGQLIEEAIQRALSEAQGKKITGKELTPFLLQRVNELSRGESLKSNIALIKNNVRVGSRIAVALNRLQRPQGWRSSLLQNENTPALRRPVVIGGINIDIIAKGRAAKILTEHWVPGDTNTASRDEQAFLHFLPSAHFQPSVIYLTAGSNYNEKDGGQTNPARVRQSFGGVGRNLADCLSRLGKMPFFISVMGKDENSESVLRHCRHMDMGGVLRLKGHHTATYCAVITGSGELTLGLGDMDIHQQITEEYVGASQDLLSLQWCIPVNHDFHSQGQVSQFKENLCLAPIICIDGNVPVSTIEYICQVSREHRLAVCYEPTDVDKASKPFLSDSWKGLTCISPNLRELRAISQTLGNPVPTELPSKLEEIVETAIALACPLLKELHYVVVTLGQHGVLLCGRNIGGSISLRPQIDSENTAEELYAAHYPAIPVPREEILNVSGAGDSLMAGIIAGLLAGEDTEACLQMGLLLASLSLRSYEPVSPEINSTSMSLARLKTQLWPEANIWKLPVLI